MATPPTSSSASSNSGPSASSATGSNSKKDKSKSISVKIQPTIGPSFSLSLPATTRISSLKESISDKMGLSPQKMTLLLHSNELETGTLTSNSIEEGTEIRLVPAVESGVTTVNSVDPVAMMKHSMSGISDQQIDDFLNGKSPLSVAIRVGESVVVVNLHRAKVEEIEVDPPPTKRRCIRSRHPSSEDTDSPISSPPRSHLSRTTEGLRHLNSNNSSDEVMDTLESILPSFPSSSTATTHSSSSSRRRSTARLQEYSLRTTVKDKTHNRNTAAVASTPSMPSSSSSSSVERPMTKKLSSRKRLLPTAGGSSASNGLSLTQCLKSSSHSRKIANGISLSSSNSGISGRTIGKSSTSSYNSSRSKASSLENGSLISSSSSSSRMDRSPLPSPTSSISSHSSSKPPSPGQLSEESKANSPSSPGSPSSSISSPVATTTTNVKSLKTKSVSRSVQTDPEPRLNESRRELSSDQKDSSGRRIISRREIKLPENGVSMKRKAVMEAISEILKKMYASSDKGRLPGSFKGRFSSEFTCDSDMQEILHSKTTMTSYGSEIEDPDRKGSGSDMDTSNTPESARMSKAKYEENEQLKGKVAHLKWRMQQHRALRKAKRNGEKSACGWLEALKCDVPVHPPNEREQTGYCGLKRGFLLAD